MTDEPPVPTVPSSDSGDVEVEASGETVGEAKWTALRDLERRLPGLDKSRVRFTVLSEGERGLLGVGYAPARVVASVDAAAMGGTAAAPEVGTAAALLHEFLLRVADGLGCPASVAIDEDEDTLTATLAGPDLGRLIGRHGQTIDAVQYLANAVLARRGEELGGRKEVVVDAAGYRARRRATLERTADRAAEDVVRGGQAIALDPMSAVERKIVHLRLADRGDVETASEGTEPNRHVVIRPV